MSKADDLRREIEEKQRELQELEDEWPKRVIDYLHGCKEDAWYFCEENLGTKDPDFVQNFRGWSYEIEFELEVERDGTTRIVKVNGRELAPKPD